MNHINEIISFLLAIIPMIWLLIGFTKLKLPAYRICLIAFLTSVAIAFLYFNMSGIRIFEASFEGVMLALFPIIWVILAALFLYNTTLATGAMENIKIMLSEISPDRRVQALIIAFAFGGFLEAVAGFGTAVAIPAGILIAMGFRPIKAATVCLVANTVPVAFGVLGVPITTLAEVTSLPIDKLTLYTAAQLFPFAVFLPFVIVALVTGSIRKTKGVIFIALLSGLVFSITQTLTAYFVGPEIAAVVGSLSSLIVSVLFIKLFPVKAIWKFEDEKDDIIKHNSGLGFANSIKAWIPYILVVAIVFAVRFLPILEFLDKFPFLLKAQFYYGQGGKSMSFQLITSGGSVLFISGIIGGIIQGASFKKMIQIFIQTFKQINKTIITILSIVALAKVMSYSGMVDTVANTLANISGRFYPLIAPLIGAMGTFITGSDTSSNILFGNLQKQTALRIGMSPEWLVASNAAGATAGKMISPQSIAIAISATGLINMEGKLLEKTFKYCLIYVGIMGVLVLSLSSLFS